MRHRGASWLLPLLRHKTQHHTPSHLPPHPSPLLAPPAFQGIFGTAQHLLSWQQTERRARVGLSRRSAAICLFPPGCGSGSPPRGKHGKPAFIATVALFIAGKNWPLCGFNHQRAFGTIRECLSSSAASSQRGEPDARMPLFFISQKKKIKKKCRGKGEEYR